MVDDDDNDDNNNNNSNVVTPYTYGGGEVSVVSYIVTLFSCFYLSHFLSLFQYPKQTM